MKSEENFEIKGESFDLTLDEGVLQNAYRRARVIKEERQRQEKWQLVLFVAVALSVLGLGMALVLNGFEWLVMVQQLVFGAIALVVVPVFALLSRMGKRPEGREN